jgi:hypothetical protein
MAGARPYRNPRYAADFRELAGHASVVAVRDRCDGAPIYRVSYVSGGGDIALTSKPILVEDHAVAACRVFAEFVGASVALSCETSVSDFTGAP